MKPFQHESSNAEAGVTYLDQCNERYQVIEGHTEIVDPKRSTQERTFVTLVWSHVILVKTEEL